VLAQNIMADNKTLVILIAFMDSPQAGKSSPVVGFHSEKNPGKEACELRSVRLQLTVRTFRGVNCPNVQALQKLTFYGIKSGFAEAPRTRGL
jgi:hypothetical protein